MIFNDAFCFEITASGKISELRKFESFLESGGLDEFFEMEEDYLSFDDGYETGDDSEPSSLLFTSDEFGIEIDRFDSDEFLEVLCKAAKNLYVSGSFYDFDDNEYRFVSDVGDAYYINANSISIFNDELDEQASREDEDGEEDED